MLAAALDTLEHLSRGYRVASASRVLAGVLVDRVLDEVGVAEGGAVLELHAGSSIISEHLRRRLTRGSLTCESLACGSGAALYPEGTFDLVISRDALHCLGNRARRYRALGDAARALKPGGRLVLVDARGIRDYIPVLTAANLRVTCCRAESIMTLPRLDVLIAQRPLGACPSPRRGAS